MADCYLWSYINNTIVNKKNIVWWISSFCSCIPMNFADCWWSKDKDKMRVYSISVQFYFNNLYDVFLSAWIKCDQNMNDGDVQLKMIHVCGFKAQKQRKYGQKTCKTIASCCCGRIIYQSMQSACAFAMKTHCWALDCLPTWRCNKHYQAVWLKM